MRFGGLLESDKDAGLLALLRAIDQELKRKYRLAGAGPARQQSRTAQWQAPAGDFVETDNAGRRFPWGFTFATAADRIIFLVERSWLSRIDQLSYSWVPEADGCSR